MTDSRVVILRGPSGSGKSTYIKNNLPGAVVCSADDYHYNAAGVYDWRPANIGPSHKFCMTKFKEALDNGDPLIVVDNTNTTLKEIEPYVKFAREYDADIEIVRLDIPLEKLYGRNVHGVPDTTVKAMNDRMQAIPDSWDVPETRIKGH